MKRKKNIKPKYKKYNCYIFIFVYYLGSKVISTPLKQRASLINSKNKEF